MGLLDGKAGSVAIAVTFYTSGVVTFSTFWKVRIARPDGPSYSFVAVTGTTYAVPVSHKNH
jgi:hypothetical protein